MAVRAENNTPLVYEYLIIINAYFIVLHDSTGLYSNYISIITMSGRGGRRPGAGRPTKAQQKPRREACEAKSRSSGEQTFNRHNHDGGRGAGSGGHHRSEDLSRESQSTVNAGRGNHHNQVRSWHHSTRCFGCTS